MKQLKINNLHAGTIEGKEILKGVSLTVKPGQIHAIMGPNGGGKSTLAQVMMGHPEYKITRGTIMLNGTDITNTTPDERSKRGLFLGFQYPVEVSGVNFASFMRMILKEKSAKKIKNSKTIKTLSPIAFRAMLNENGKKLAFNDDLSGRALNEGFSGGEKKKAEILQLCLLKPDFAVLDEPDSGLDVDALRYISNAIKSLDYPLGLILITHYQRILEYIKPNFVHIMIKGKLAKSGTSELAKEIEKKGYEQFLI